MSKEKSILFSTESYGYLGERIFRDEYFEKGEITRKKFPDGEFYYRITSLVENREVVLVGGMSNDKETLEIYDLACALVSLGVRKLHIFVPYFGYSTMERAVRAGEVVMAKNRARLLSSVPQAYMGNLVYFLDLHVAGLQFYLEGEMHSAHIYAKPLVIEAARELGGSDFVLASTDAGRAKWVESLAFDMGVDAAFVYKRRTSGSETAVTGVNADVAGKNVVIYDDMIRTGGSLIQAAKSYKNAGAKSIFAIATHGIFPENSVEKIQKSEVIEHICVTDSHPNAVALASDFIRVKSCAPIFLKHFLG
jgi:ribose-phosphate pyrophosphokinase